MKSRIQNLQAFLGRRLSPGEYLGLHLTVGFVVSMAALGLFGLITYSWMGLEDVPALDRELAVWSAEHRQTAPSLRAFFRDVTVVGSVKWMTGYTILVALVLLMRRQKLLALVWVVTLASGGLMDAGLKLVFLRERPPLYLRDEAIHQTSKSFPSGHSMGSVIGYGLLAYLLVLTLPHRWGRYTAACGLAVLVLAIGLSRIYLGAHWLTDVLGGYTAGVVWLAVWISGIEVVRRRRRSLAAAEPAPTNRIEGG